MNRRCSRTSSLGLHVPKEKRAFPCRCVDTYRCVCVCVCGFKFSDSLRRVSLVKLFETTPFKCCHRPSQASARALMLEKVKEIKPGICRWQALHRTSHWSCPPSSGDLQWRWTQAFVRHQVFDHREPLRPAETRDEPREVLRSGMHPSRWWVPGVDLLLQTSVQSI